MLPGGRGRLIELLSEVKQAAEFYDALGRLAATPLPRPPLHVTLYTFGDVRGIGLPTLEALKQRTVSRRPPPRADPNAVGVNSFGVRARKWRKWDRRRLSSRRHRGMER